jgi:rod shape-determining protein MreD
MATFIAFPILISLVILQSAVFSRFPLLNGTTDLVLLVVIAWALQKRVTTSWQWGIIGGLLVGFVSALPFIASLALYMASVGIALLLKQRVWRAPVLAMLIATFLSTILFHSVTFIILRITGSALPFRETLNLITMPSLVLNLLLSFPIYALIADLAKWLYPEELVV